MGVVTENRLKNDTQSKLESQKQTKIDSAVWLTEGQCRSALIQDRELPQCPICQETHCECHPNEQVKCQLKYMYMCMYMHHAMLYYCTTGNFGH